MDAVTEKKHYPPTRRVLHVPCRQSETIALACARFWTMVVRGDVTLPEPEVLEKPKIEDTEKQTATQDTCAFGDQLSLF